MSTVLVTGGTGYIGSHCVIELLHQNYNVVIVDNLENSNIKVLERIESITGKKPVFYQVDMNNAEKLDAIFEQHKIDSVIHFAGLKAVGESTQIPMKYYRNNLVITMNLLDSMEKHNVRKLVFSSSATVYGPVNPVPYTESMPTSATNPYGQTKLMIEQMLQDCFAANDLWNMASLRYFNPVGAHKSGLVGEDPNGIPNNLVPFVAQVAVGRRDSLQVFGGDYETPDGTGVRDYIHVTDLVAGHIKALEFLNKRPSGYSSFNLGTGKGTSVLELIEAFKKASGKPIPYKIVDRRAGDIAFCYGETTLAENELNWRAELTIDDMCRDTWNWQQKNPNGFE